MKVLFDWIKLMLGNRFKCDGCHNVKDNYDAGLYLSDEKGYRVFCKECARTNQEAISSFKRILE
jgi:hypothetical protein